MLAGQCNGSNYGSRILLRRDLPDSAAQYLAANLRDTFFGLSIVLDEGEEWRTSCCLGKRHGAAALRAPGKKRSWLLGRGVPPSSWRC